MMPKSILWGVCIALCFIFSNCSSQTPPVAATETTPSVIAARNKAMTQRYYSQFSDHNPESPKCFAADFVDRIDPTIKGPEHIKIFNETMYKTWPDVKVTVEQIVAEGKVITIDVDSLRQELFKHSEWQTKRKSKGVAQLEAHYRLVMGL